MRRKPLFPPVDPQTHRRRQDKGSDPHDLLTVNGRVRIRRKHFHTRHEGTTTPVDKLLDAAEATVSVGVREMCSRVNSEAGSFARAAANLERTAQWLQRIGLDYVKRHVVDDAKNRSALYRQLLAALAARKDPWQERTHEGSEKQEFKILEILDEVPS